MRLLILFSVLVFVTDSAELLERLFRSNLEFPIASIDLNRAFKSFLRKTLSPDGAYHRHLLVSTGIVKEPPNYSIPRDFPHGVLPEEPLTPELYDHFVKNIYDIINSEKTLMNALYILLGERLFQIELKRSKDLLAEDDSDLIKIVDARASSPVAETEMNTGNQIVALKLRQSKSAVRDYVSKFVNLNPEAASLYFATGYETVTEPDEVFSTINSETESLKTDALTTEYVDFLTDGLKSSHSHADERICESGQICTTKSSNLNDHTSETEPFTGNYIRYLETDPDFSSASTTAEEQTLVYEKILTPEYSMPSEITSTESVQDRSPVESDNTDDDTTLAAHKVTDHPMEYAQLIEDVFKFLDEKFEERSESTVVPNIESLVTKPDQITSEQRTDMSPNLHRKSKQMNIADGTAKLNKNETRPRLFLIPGTPGVNFPYFEEIPITTFTCNNKKHIPGFYADQESECQAFHVCWPGRRESFLCPIGTTFNQAILACDYWYNSNCSISPAYFDVNTAFKEADSTKTGTTGPMVDTLIKASQRESEVIPEIISTAEDIDEMYEADVHFSEALAKHELSQIWRFLPIKARIYIQPQPPELLEFLARQHKHKRSKGNTEGIPTPDTDSTLSLDQQKSQDRKEKVKSIILKVLEDLISSRKYGSV